MSKKLLSILALLCLTVTGAMAQSYTITLPSVSNGSLTAKVNDASVTSAAAGATVSLVATPDAGYRLKTISGTYQGAPEETFQKGAATREGSYFRLVASANNNAGWRLNTGSTSTITITSKNAGTLIDKVELNITPGNTFDFNLITVSSGTKARNGNVITITGINNTTLTITGTGNAAKGCTGSSARITGTGLVDKALTISSTGDDNVKTFTMPEGNVTISAEFELAPVNLTANSDGAATPSYWATYYNGTTSYTADANTTVYKAAMNGTSSLMLTEVANREIPADKAVILKSSSATITLTPAASITADLSDNVLKGGTTVESGYDAYTLSRGSDGNGTVGFYKFNGASLDGSKAHLEILSSSPAPARGFFGFGDDNTTAIEAPTATIIVEDGEIYDLAGRRIEGQPTRKGIYVKNGQKFIVK